MYSAEDMNKAADLVHRAILLIEAYPEAKCLPPGAAPRIEKMIDDLRQYDCGGLIEEQRIAVESLYETLMGQPYD